MQTDLGAQTQTTAGIGTPDAAVPAPSFPHMPTPHPDLVTIGENTCEGISTRLNGEPQRKRQRVADGECVLMARNSDDIVASGTSSMHTQHYGKSATKWVKDDKFYLDSGDCVIRVENTLFKVHRFLLARDSSAFQDMFSMPGHDYNSDRNGHASEGASDDRPIVLQGESARDFRALLPMLYALPAEIQEYSTQRSPIPKLISIAKIANKYHFSTTGLWAIDTLYKVLVRGGLENVNYDLRKCCSSLLRRVVEVGLLCEHQALWEHAVDVWIERLWARELNPLIAMRVADEYLLYRLKGVSYYVALMVCGIRLEWDPTAFVERNDDDEEEDEEDRWGGEVDASARRSPSSSDRSSSSCSPSPSPSPRTTLEPTPVQKARLLSGFYSLTHLWDCIRTSGVPTFPRPPGCTYHSHGCLSTLRAVWQGTCVSEATLTAGSGSSADVVARMKSIEAQLMADRDLQCALTPACRREAMSSLRGMCDGVMSGLPDHFVDVTRGEKGRWDGL